MIKQGYKKIRRHTWISPIFSEFSLNNLLSQTAQSKSKIFYQRVGHYQAFTLVFTQAFQWLSVERMLCFPTSIPSVTCSEELDEKCKRMEPVFQFKYQIASYILSRNASQIEKSCHFTSETAIQTLDYFSLLKKALHFNRFSFRNVKIAEKLLLQSILLSQKNLLLFSIIEHTPFKTNNLTIVEWVQSRTFLLDFTQKNEWRKFF